MRYFKFHQEMLQILAATPSTAEPRVNTSRIGYTSVWFCGHCHYVYRGNTAPTACSHCNNSGPFVLAGPAMSAFPRARCSVCARSHWLTFSMADETVCVRCVGGRAPSATERLRCAECGNLTSIGPHWPHIQDDDGHYVCLSCCTWALSLPDGHYFRQLSTPALPNCACGGVGELPSVDGSTAMCMRCIQVPWSRAPHHIQAPAIGDPHPTFPNHLSLGMEIECIVKKWNPDISRLAVVKGDGSVRATHGGKAIEIAMQPVSGALIPKVYKEAATLLKDMSAYVNSSCGLHMHVGVKKLKQEECTRVRAWWRVFEPIFFAMLPAWRRSNGFCRPIGDTIEARWNADRYFALNISAQHKYGTYEFRLTDGSLDYDYMMFWASLFINFINSAVHIDMDETTLAFLAKASDREILHFFFKALNIPRPLVRQATALILYHGGTALKNRYRMRSALKTPLPTPAIVTAAPAAPTPSPTPSQVPEILTPDDARDFFTSASHIRRVPHAFGTPTTTGGTNV